MLSRRRFIESGVAGSIVCGAAGSIAYAAAGSVAWGAAGSAAGAAGMSPAETVAGTRADRMPLYAVLFDERYPAAVRFGHAAEQDGLPARAVRADVTRIWYDELDPLWRRQSRPIAGLTAYAALFCLERLAWSHGMRVVYHRTHASLTSGTVDWARQLALRLGAADREWAWSPLPHVAGARAGDPGPGQPLHSWVIAPVMRELEST